jgi:hypothetical protein
LVFMKKRTIPSNFGLQMYKAFFYWKNFCSFFWV